MATTVGEGERVSSGKKIALFYKGCPYPAQSGLQRRVLELIRGLSELDYEVFFFSTHRFTETPWTAEGISWLRANGVAGIGIYGTKSQ
jgi:hypothetical protein